MELTEIIKEGGTLGIVAYLYVDMRIRHYKAKEEHKKAEAEYQSKIDKLKAKLEAEIEKRSKIYKTLSWCYGALKVSKAQGSNGNVDKALKKIEDIYDK